MLSLKHETRNQKPRNVDETPACADSTTEQLLERSNTSDRSQVVAAHGKVSEVFAKRQLQNSSVAEDSYYSQAEDKYTPTADDPSKTVEEIAQSTSKIVSARRKEAFNECSSSPTNFALWKGPKCQSGFQVHPHA